ncbi:GNAT family N-acetyltransferase [Nocardioides campestrisoli]|uniref:GNAT family N-acetyltransferase n=1 Tax=Nocardioides campestrisoli TaxID=2736757 RepID=UPI0017483344|nr:GNAT family N-acetyltransferase [Nocardioides campestrisoli]
MGDVPSEIGPPEPDSDAEARPGAHMLGPHVIGQRVVVRRLLPGQTGPTGGPAMTDVLGTCRSWADGVCEIERADGSVVAIEVATIVSGKPVPPRPSVRHRVGVREAELRTASLWADVHLEPLGEWVLRTQPSPVGRAPQRANSCLTVGDPGLDLDDALAEVEAFYTARDRRVLAHVEAGSSVEAALRERGWGAVPDGSGPALFLLAGTSRALRAARASAPAGETGGPGETGETVVEAPEGARVSVSLAGGAARGRAALTDGWLGLHDLYVDPDRRRTGLARHVVARLLEWGAEQGATTAWLHVEVANAAARSLYESLGFTAHHEMTYLTTPARPA